MGPARAVDAVLTKILRFCRYCDRETAHEVRNGSHGAHVSCTRCRERALLEELDRD